MPVITISRGSYSAGKAVAEEVAERLGYDCISRDIETETLKTFDIPEAALSEAIHKAPSVLDKLIVRKEIYLAYYAAVLLKHLKGDNVVYHGLAGHFFVRNVPHVLKVRVITEMESRAELAMDDSPVSREEAMRMLIRDDEARRRWSRHFFKLDTNDPYLYDLVIQVNKLSIEEAATIIHDVARRPRFQSTADSTKAIQDLALAAAVKAELIRQHANVEVAADGGVVRVHLPSSDPRKMEAVKDAVGAMAGVTEVVLDADGEITRY